MANMKSVGVVVGVFLTTLLIPSIAHADLAACGGAWLFAGAECRFLADEACSAACEPAAMAASCAARLYGDCDAACAAAAEAGCTEGCRTACGGECHLWQVHEDPPDSMRLCMSNCQQACDVTCDGSEVDGCRSICDHNCGEQCEQANCRSDDQAVTCGSKCGVSCTGSCQARASGECLLSCHSDRTPACAAELVDRCLAACDRTGAIFCDGQFLDAAQLQACADEIEAELFVHLEVTRPPPGPEPGDEGSLGCSVDPEGPGGLLLALGALGVLGRRRRR